MNAASKPRRPPRGILFDWARGILLTAMAIAAVFTAIMVHYRTSDIMAAADARLLMAAEMLREIVGPDFHDRLDGPGSLSVEEFEAIVERNNDLCRRLGLQYLWSVLQLDEDTLVFTTATHSDVHDPASPVASFFEVHRDPRSFDPALGPGWAPAFSTFHNEWGRGRMILVPSQDALGRTYLFGASIQLTQYNALVRQSLLAGLVVFFVVMAGAFPAVLFLSRRMISPIARLTEAADRMAAGDLDVAPPSAGPKEIQSLAGSLDQMRQDLKDRLSALREGEARLNRANADLRRFAEVSAHHLQEPSRRLASYAMRLHKSLAGKLDDEEALTELGFIRQDAERLRGLLQDIQLYLAAGDPIGAVQRQDARAVLQGVTDAKTDDIQAAGAEVLIRDLPAVVLDRRRLAEIFSILLVNALKYRRPDRPACIEFSGQRTEQGARLRVADNGQGIPEAYRERVFGVFERLHPGGEGAGTGIGLAIVRRIAESRGGRVWIEDSELGGTAVVVVLPEMGGGLRD